MNKNLPTIKRSSNLALKRAKNLLSIADKILNKNSALAKEVFGHGIYVGLGHSVYVNSVAISPEGNIVSGISDDTIKLWDIISGKEIRTFKGFSSSEKSIAINPDGRYIVSGSGNVSGIYNNTIKLWDIISGKVLRTLKGHSENVRLIALSTDGKYIVSESKDDIIKLWDIASGKEIRLRQYDDYGDIYNYYYDGYLVELTALSTDGKYIVSGSWDGAVKLWDIGKDINSGQEIRTFWGHSCVVTSVAINPNGKCIVSGSEDGTIKLWDIENSKEIRTFKGHSDSVSSVVLSPNEKYMVSGSGDGAIKLWDIENGEEIAQFVSFRDGEWISSTKDGYYNCSENAYKYFNFQNNKEVIIDKSHPIYKQRKKKNLLEGIIS